MTQTDPQVYYNSMKHYPYGYALFQPESTSNLRPGMCGYIDESGRWQYLVDLTDNEMVKAAGYTQVGPLQRDAPETQIWGPRIADTVKHVEVSIDSEASALSAGLPIDAEVLYKYSTSADFGAILMSDSEVVVDSYNDPESLTTWLMENSDKLLANHPIVKGLGLYIATRTYSSSNIHVNVWQNSEDEITLGIKAGVTEIGKLDGSVTWMRGSATHSWTDYITPNGGRVMFFSGIKIKFHRLSWANHKIKEIPLDEWVAETKESVFVNRAEHGEHYKAEVEMIGYPPREVKANGNK